MQASNLLKKVLKPRNVASPSSPNSSSSARQQGSGGGGGGGAASGGKKENVTKFVCSCSPTTHPGSFRCRLHRTPQGRSTGLTPSAMPKPERPPFKGTGSYIVTPVDINTSQLPKATVPRLPKAKNQRNKPSRLSRMVRASSVCSTPEADAVDKTVVDEHSIGSFQEGGETRVAQCKDPDAFISFDSELLDFELAQGKNSLPRVRTSSKDDPTAKLQPPYSVNAQTLDSFDDLRLKTGPENREAREEEYHMYPEEMVEESKLYVEPLRILDYKQHVLPNSTSTAFLVQWENLPAKDATWETSTFIGGYPLLLREFLQRRCEQGDSIDFFQAMENAKALNAYLNKLQENKQEATMEQEKVVDQVHEEEQEDKTVEQVGDVKEEEEQDEDEAYNTDRASEPPSVGDYLVDDYVVEDNISNFWDTLS